MSREADLIERLRGLATHPAARALRDDAAVLAVGGETLVLTHDMLVAGVHYLPDDPPGDIAWKLVAVNLSDLAAKGARPIGALLGYPLGPTPAWDEGFVAGLAEALAAFHLPLLGGDTVARADAMGLTALGLAGPGGAPSRAGARPGDALWVTGRIGAAGLGLAALLAGSDDPAGIAAYRRPRPRLAEGRALAPLVTAMADVSDGLLVDAARMAEASGLAVAVALDAVPFAAGAGEQRADRLRAATAGDDYELLFALPPDTPLPPGVAAARIGGFAPGAGLALTDRGAPLPLPARLGFEHGGAA